MTTIYFNKFHWLGTKSNTKQQYFHNIKKTITKTHLIFFEHTILFWFFSFKTTFSNLKNEWMFFMHHMNKILRSLTLNFDDNFSKLLLSNGNQKNTDMLGYNTNTRNCVALKSTRLYFIWISVQSRWLEVRINFVEETCSSN